MSGDELARCPFCGGEATFEQTEEGPFGATRWTVGCNERENASNTKGNDEAAGAILCYGYQSLTTFATKKEAAAAWNRRASLSPPAGQVDERVREILERLRTWADERNKATPTEAVLLVRAADLLESLVAQLAEAEQQLAEADAVICAADSPPLDWWDDQQDRDAITRASERHADRASRRTAGERT